MVDIDGVLVCGRPVSLNRNPLLKWFLFIFRFFNGAAGKSMTADSVLREHV